MRTTLVWADVLPAVDGAATVVWDIAFRSDGSLLVVAAGRYLIVYNSADGVKVKTRQGSLGSGHLQRATPIPGPGLA
jgi:hypothetical protein